MPLHDGAIDAIRQQLECISIGERVSLIVIGCLTRTQHDAIRAFRASRNLPGAESPEIVYLGRHHFASRSKQGYTVEDLLRQIDAGLSADAVPFIRGSMTSLMASRPRDDGYGKQVRDHAVLELTARKPRVELFSVIPKGDGR
ncbi:hypothetical protein [Noviluteimonas gilva]|uniref:Uncharacterized protein n=1 Tax=Noviluteimonas gilva TaxID=2682097 RepID=A0A7C9HNQ4_9GAMM|nr:hypothetical protein [Lysobacter gilvus]MUV15332.1 hypothetical protein [Lysobacter gilvus]